MDARPDWTGMGRCLLAVSRLYWLALPIPKPLAGIANGAVLGVLVQGLAFTRDWRLVAFEPAKRRKEGRLPTMRHLPSPVD